MKREDIQYFNSWNKSFEKCSVATIMKGLLNGIWISSNKDPEDIYRIFPKLIITETGGSAEICKQFGTIPFEFSFEDSEFDENDNLVWKHRGRLMSGYGSSWSLNKEDLLKEMLLEN